MLGDPRPCEDGDIGTARRRHRAIIRHSGTHRDFGQAYTTGQPGAVYVVDGLAQKGPGYCVLFADGLHRKENEFQVRRIHGLEALFCYYCNVHAAGNVQCQRDERTPLIYGVSRYSRRQKRLLQLGLGFTHVSSIRMRRQFDNVDNLLRCGLEARLAHHLDMFGQIVLDGHFVGTIVQANGRRVQVEVRVHRHRIFQMFW